MSKSRFFHSIAVAALAAGFTAAPAAADIHWQVEMTSVENGEPVKETTDIWANDENLRMGAPGDGEVLFLGGENKTIMIDHDKKQYMVLDGAKVAAKTAAVKPQFDAAMAAAFEGLDEETRAMAMAAMQGGAGAPGGLNLAASMGAPSYDVTKTNTMHTVLGAKAVAYDVEENGAKKSEIWAAKASDVKGGVVVRDRMKDMMGYVDNAFGAFSPMDGGPFQFLEDLDGRVPVGSVAIEPNGAETRAMLVSAEEKPAPDGLWGAPTDYALQETPF